MTSCLFAIAVAPPFAGAAVVGHWQLNETSGTSAVDVSGNANNGTLTGGPVWTAGKIGGGLSFDGVGGGADDIVNAGSGATLDDLVAQGGGGMTASAWIKATTMGEGGLGRIVAKGTGSALGWQLFLVGTNQVSFFVDHTTTDLTRTTSTNAIAMGAWYHVALTWTGSTAITSAKIYINGVEATYVTTPDAAGARPSDGSASLTIGNEIGGARTFNGVLDDVRVYNNVLTPAEIQTLYLSGSIGLVGHWQLNETSGTSAADASGNANNGTLTGGPVWTAGKIGGGLSFDGVGGGADDIVNAGSGATLDDLVAQGGGGMTASAWIKATTMGESNLGRIVAKGTGAALGWQLFLVGTNQVSFFVDHTTTDLTRTTTTNAIGLGAWYHVALTWTGSVTATNAKIYINGAEATYATTTNAVGARQPDGSASLTIGNEIGGTRTFNGVLDDVRVYCRVLSLSEIQALATPLDITTASLPAGYTNISYGNQQLAATGGTTPYTWALASGSLPAGITGPTSGGVISGTPTTAGTSNFTVQVIDTTSQTDTQPLAITINTNSIPDITTTSLPGAGLGVAYSQSVTSTGGDVALVWSVLSGSLPTGISLSNVNSQNATVSGTPTALGTFNFTLQLADVHSDTDTQPLSIAVTDVTAPTVALTAPASGATVRSTISVTADASDNVGVAGVQFKLDGADLGAEDTTSPYSISWDTTTATNGSHSLTAVARDAAGNTTTSTAVNVTVDNAAPTVAITAPLNGATVSSTIAVTADASDNVGVAGVQFKLDGADLGSEDTTSPYSINWNTTTATNGSHALTAVARDAADNTTTSSAINVTVNNVGPQPVAHWKLDETTGTNANDETANNNDGTLTGFSGTYWVAGQVGNALNFDGVDDRVNANSGASLDNLVSQGGGGMTLVAWIKADTLGEGVKGRIVDKSTAVTPLNGWAFFVGGTNQLTFIADYSTTDLNRSTAVNAISLGAWRHVAVTWTGSATATDVKFYVDGVQTAYGTTIDGLGALANDGAANLSVGNDSTGARTFDGLLDDVRVYNSVLTPADILALYQAGGSPIESSISALSPTAWWKLGANGNDSVGTKTAVANGTVTWGVAGPLGQVNAVDLGGTGDLEIAHHADFETTYTVTRTIVATTDAQFRSAVVVSGWFYVNSGGLVDNAVIASKDDNENAFGATNWGWTLRAMANGSMILRSRTHFRPVELKAPAGTITAGTWHHVWLRWDRRGMTAAIDGKQFADGYPTALDWYGWKHRIRTVTYINAAKIRIGKSGSSTNPVRANIRAAQWAVFMATSDAARQTIANAQSLAQSGSVPALNHYIFGLSSVTEPPGPNLQAAIDARNAAGGGRVVLQAGTYTGNIILKNNVEIVGVGIGSTILTGNVKTQPSTETPITKPSTGLSAGSTSWTLQSNHGVVAGDWLWMMSTRALQSRWSNPVITGAGAPADPNHYETELVRIKSVNVNTVTFDQPTYFDYPTSQLQSVRRITPHKNMGLRGLTISYSGTPFDGNHIDALRLIHIRSENPSTLPDKMGARVSTCMAVDSPVGFESHTVSQLQSFAYGFLVTNITRDLVAIGSNVFSYGWHALAHGGSSNYGAGVLWCDHVDGTYSSTGGATRAAVDAHGVVAEVRVIGGEITSGGGTSVCGYRCSVEDLKITGSATQSTFLPWDGSLECYYRNILFPDVRDWFATESLVKGFGDCHLQDFQYTGTPLGWVHTCTTDLDHPNTYDNVLNPPPYP